MYRRFLLIMAFTCLASSLFAHLNAFEYPHKKKKKTFFQKENILIGPGLGFGATQNAFSFNISPSIAYSFSNYFYAGVTLGFNYYQEKVSAYNFYTNQTEIFRYKIPSYAFSIYARAIVANNFILNFEPMLMSVKNYTSYPYADPITKKLKAENNRISISSLLIGGGYCQHYSERSHLYYMACYDVAQNPNSPYYGTLAMRIGLMLTLFDK